MNPFSQMVQPCWKQKQEESMLKALPQRTLTSSLLWSYEFLELNAVFLIPSSNSDPFFQKDCHSLQNECFLGFFGYFWFFFFEDINRNQGNYYAGRDKRKRNKIHCQHQHILTTGRKKAKNWWQWHGIKLSVEDSNVLWNKRKLVKEP